MNETQAGLFRTYSGRVIDFGNFGPHDVDISEVANALSHLCRFGGHCKTFYSVAQHAVLVAQELEANGCDRMTIYTGLHHDDSEAYLGDVVKPLKMLLPNYEEIEDRFAFALSQAFGFIYPFPNLVHIADRLMFERENETVRFGKAPRIVEAWGPDRARFEYLSMHEQLYAQINHTPPGVLL